MGNYCNGLCFCEIHDLCKKLSLGQNIFRKKNVVLFCFLIVENFIQYGQEQNILPWNTGEVSM